MDLEKIVTELCAQVDCLEDKVTEQDAMIEKLQYTVEALATTDYDSGEYSLGYDEEWVSQ